jgi:Ca-activated chloride channel family protein
MAADDIEPTRLEAAKEAARQFVQNQPPTVLVGVVAFSNGGLVVQKPTDDRAALLAAVDRFSPQGGTSLGQGIFTSLNAIAGAPIAIAEDSLEQDGETIQIGDFPSAVIILLSDGENTSQPDPLTIAQVAAEAGVRIYPIGIGSPAGSVLEIEGYNVLSQLDEGVLEQIAGLTNGAYFRAEDAAELQEVYNNIDLRLTVRGEKMEATSLFAVIGLALFMVAGVASLSWFGRVP